MSQRNRSRNKVFCTVTSLCLCLATYTLSHAEEKPQRAPALTLIHISDTHVCKLAGFDSRFIEKRQHLGGARKR